MTRFLSSGNRYLRQGARFVGQGRALPTPLELEYPPADFEGAVAYGDDGKLYYSDGESWLIPQDDVEISRPTARPPTNSVEQTQLRLSNYRSPAGLVQAGILIQISTNGTDFNSPITRTVVSDFANLYQIIYPEDGFEPGDEIFWRGAYFAEEGVQSDFSLPLKQTYPDFIDNPLAATREGATTGAVALTPFISPFGFNYVETQIEFYNIGEEPGVSTPVATVTSVQGASVAVPDTIAEGVAYLWRGRYGGRSGASGPVLFTDWTPIRSFLNGARSMVLVYDPALAPSRTINLPLGVHLPAGGAVNVLVDWGDGTTDTYTTPGNKTHTYAANVEGLVTVSISGTLTQFGGNVNQIALVRVDNIGFGLGLTSLRGMFRNTSPNLTFVSPNLPPQVTDLSEAFMGENTAPGFEVQTLDVSNVQNLSSCFESNIEFNQPLAGWDTGSATNMSRMFFNGVLDVAQQFNQPLGNWNVSKVTDMSFMFGCFNSRCSQNFNQNIGSWDVSSVVTMRSMFDLAGGNSDAGTHAFNNGGSDSIRNWNTVSLTNVNSMFRGGTHAQPTHSFNQRLDGWDTSSIMDFGGIFSYNRGFNQSLAGWNLSSATNVAQMFYRSSFNNDVSGWVLPADISRLFERAKSFNHPSVVGWDTSGVTDMSFMFQDAGDFNQPIGNWDVSNVTTIEGMFACTISAPEIFMEFNQSLSNWNVSKVSNMRRVFGTTSSSGGSVSNTNAFNQPIGNWDVSNVTDMFQMFGGSSRGRGFFNQDISNWKLNTIGVNLSGLLSTAINFSTENYSKLLAGWANSITEHNGPFNVVAGFGARTYNADEQFPDTLYPDAVVGRAYLTNSNRLTVSGASTVDADGNYLFNSAVQLYVKSNDWFFFKNGTVWELRDNLDAVQATQQDSANLGAPQLVQTWDGVLATATVLRTGAAWTITDGGLEA